MTEGGGLWLTGLAWGYLQTTNLPPASYGMNLIGRRFGIRFEYGQLNDPTNCAGGTGNPVFHAFYPASPVGHTPWPGISDARPQPSPSNLPRPKDGEWIVLSSAPPGQSKANLWLFSPDAKTRLRLTNEIDYYDYQPMFSPDRRRVRVRPPRRPRLANDLVDLPSGW